MGNVISFITNVRQYNNGLISSAHPELSIFRTGTIPDETLWSGLGAAVATNNTYLLKLLLHLSNVDVNRSDNQGNTLLQAAIINNSTGVFKCLIQRNDIDVNALNLQQASALTIAAVSGKTYFVKKLIEKGANVNQENTSGCIPLHYACQHNLLKISKLLIKAGSDINVRNLSGKTPLYVACQYGREEIIHMLIYYGADVSIPAENGTLPLMVDKFNELDLELRLILYALTFDGTIFSIELKTLVRAMVLKWPLFPKMLEQISLVLYQKQDLQDFNDALPDIGVEYFELFLEKFRTVVKDMLLYCCTLTNYLTVLENMKRFKKEQVDFIYVFLQKDLGCELTGSICRSSSPISSLINVFRKSNLPLTSLTDLVCSLLSFGGKVTPDDLNAVYVFYGHCELFEILLHMDVEISMKFSPCCTLYDHEVIQKSIMPYFIYDVNLNIDRFLQNPKAYLLMDLDVLLNFFSTPKLKDFFLEDGALEKITKRIRRLPSVPSLMELARNATRKYIIHRFHTKNSSQFYTVLKWLPLNNVYKKIISYERVLYCT